MIIAIDGVAVSGKSTIALLLAQKLNFFYINSGLLYRSIAYLMVEEYGSSYQGFLSELRQDDIAHLYEKYKVRYDFDGRSVFLTIYEKDSTAQLKGPLVDSIVSLVASFPPVRNYITMLQRRLAHDHANVIIEGRDIASHVFPDADYKFFITARLAVRVRRWLAMQRNQNNHLQMSFEDICFAIEKRDEQDMSRSCGALVKVKDAIMIDTSDLTQEEVLQKILDIII